MATTIFEQQTLTFAPNDSYGGLYAYMDWNMFVLVEGETYEVHWGEDVYTLKAEAMSLGDVSGIGIGNKAIFGIGANTEEPFIMAYNPANEGNAIFLRDQSTSHTIAIYQINSNGVVLKNYHGTPVTYEGVNYVALKKTDGGTAMFVSEHLVQNQVQADWAQTDETAVDYIKNKPESELPKATTDDNGKVLGVVDGIWSKIDAPSGGGNCSCPTGTIEKETKIEYTMTEAPSISCDFIDGAKLYKISDTTFSKEELLLSEWTVQVQGQVTNATWSESDIIINTEDILMATKDGFVIAMCYKSGEITVEIDIDLIATVNFPEAGLYLLTDPEVIEYFIGMQLTVNCTIIEEVNFVQSDWNQTDKTKPDYIKNKPFYDNTKVDEIITNHKVTEIPNLITLSSDVVTLFANNFDEAHIVWDDATYKCKPEVIEDAGVTALCFGNTPLVSGGEDNGIPFVIGVAQEGEDFIMSIMSIKDADPESINHTISFSLVTENTVQIDPKFIPSIKWNQIANKPFGSISAGEIIYSATVNCIRLNSEAFGCFIMRETVNLQVGTTYIVETNGISEEIVCTLEEKNRVLRGNNIVIMVPPYEDIVVVVVQAEGEYTFSIAPKNATILPISKTYLPDDIGGTPAIDTTADEGKFLRVVGGVAAWSTVPNAEEASF